MIKKIGIMLVIVVMQLLVAYLIVDYAVHKNLPSGGTRSNQAIDPSQLSNYDFGELVVNPSDSKGKNFFIAKIVLLYHNDEKDFLEIIEKSKPLIIDSLQTVIMSRKTDDLNTLIGREELRQALESTIESIIGIKIVKLLFSKYLIQ